MPGAEQWRPVVGYEGVYLVSDRGRVRRVSSGHIMSAHPISKSGHLGVLLTKTGKPKTRKIHQLVAEAFLGPRPSPRHEVRHMDGITTSNWATNLAWGTHKQNMADLRRHGKTTRGRAVNRGSRHGMAKLGEAEVGQIKAQLASGVPPTTLASRWGVSVWTIYGIRSGRSWKHVLEGTRRA